MRGEGQGGSAWGCCPPSFLAHLVSTGWAAIPKVVQLSRAPEAWVPVVAPCGKAPTLWGNF